MLQVHWMSGLAFLVNLDHVGAILPLASGSRLYFIEGHRPLAWDAYTADYIGHFDVAESIDDINRMCGMMQMAVND